MKTTQDARFWNRAARKYARSKIADTAGYEKTLARTRALLSPSDRVLELGCGTGTTALRLADAVARYSATDISPTMIDIAREKLAAAPVPGLSFDVATAQDLASGSARFNAVLGFSYLHLVRDLPETLARIHTLLVPGGLFISKTPCLREMNPMIRLVLLPLMRTVRLAPYVECFDAAMLGEHLAAAGFRQEALEYHATRGKDSRPFLVARKI